MAAFGSIFVVAALWPIPADARRATDTAVSIGQYARRRIGAQWVLAEGWDIDVTSTAASLATGTSRRQRIAGKPRNCAIPGIVRVENLLTVEASATKGTTGTMKSKAREGAEQTKEGVEKLGEATKEGAGKVADKTKEGLSKTGEKITDGWITTRVHSKFVGEDLLKDSDINVDTNDHVVTLRGTVMSAAARARAVAQAKEVEGVHTVIDQLTIGPKR
jgi:osmotically-inducible protein OsmY